MSAKERLTTISQRAKSLPESVSRVCERVAGVRETVSEKGRKVGGALEMATAIPLAAVLFSINLPMPRGSDLPKGSHVQDEKAPSRRDQSIYKLHEAYEKDGSRSPDKDDLSKSTRKDVASPRPIKPVEVTPAKEREDVEKRYEERRAKLLVELKRVQQQKAREQAEKQKEKAEGKQGKQSGRKEPESTRKVPSNRTKDAATKQPAPTVKEDKKDEKEHGGPKNGK